VSSGAGARARRLAAAALLALAGPLPAGLPALGVALAAPAWRAEFDEICAKTQDAMALSDEELRGLVARSDKLLLELERLEPTQRKVFLKRLEGCRNLYQFVLDTRARG